MHILVHRGHKPFTEETHFLTRSSQKDDQRCAEEFCSKRDPPDHPKRQTNLCHAPPLVFFQNPSIKEPCLSRLPVACFPRTPLALFSLAPKVYWNRSVRAWSGRRQAVYSKMDKFLKQGSSTLVLFKDGRADPLWKTEHVKISNIDLHNGLTIVEQYHLRTQALFVQCLCLRTGCGGEEHRSHVRLELGWLRMHANCPVPLAAFSWLVYTRVGRASGNSQVQFLPVIALPPHIHSHERSLDIGLFLFAALCHS
jgi:hypothetical protein